MFIFVLFLFIQWHITCTTLAFAGFFVTLQVVLYFNIYLTVNGESDLLLSFFHVNSTIWHVLLSCGFFWVEGPSSPCPLFKIYVMVLIWSLYIYICICIIDVVPFN